MQGLHEGGAQVLLQVLLIAGLLLSPVGLSAQEAGDLDPSFGDGDGKVTTKFGDFATARAVALHPHAKIVAAGVSRDDFALARYLSDGTLDTTFGGGRVTTDFGGIDSVWGVAVQPDGKIVAAGETINVTTRIGDFALARYHPDGTLDTTFGDFGLVATDFGRSHDNAFAVVLQPNGKIVAVGASGDGFALARYQPDGTLDTTFGNDGLVITDFGGDTAGSAAFAAVRQPNGKIVAAGFAIARLGFEMFDFALARYHPDGTLDTTFGGDGLVTTDFGERDEAFAVALQPDGKIVSAGSTINARLQGVGEFALTRHNRDGTPDATFGSNGRVTTDFLGGFDVARGVAVLPAGQIVAAGVAKNVRDDFALARYLPDGTLDTTFGGDGRVTTDFAGRDDNAWAVALQPDAKVVLAGSTHIPFPSPGAVKFGLARYESGLGPPTNKKECKNGGWRTFTVPRRFKNQGDCIQFVNTGR